jgi:hypothetical protein
MYDVLQLCEQLTDHSVEQLSMRIVGEILLHLLCAQGLRETDMLDSIKKFRNGKWEKLWGKVIKASNKLKCKRAANPAQPRARTASQKDSYAQKCAKAGNYSKGRHVQVQLIYYGKSPTNKPTNRYARLALSTTQGYPLQ